MTDFDRFKAILLADAPPAAECASALCQAKEVATQASARVGALRGQRREMLTASEPERTKHKRALAEAEDRVADATLYVEELEKKLAQAQAGEAEATRRAQYDAVSAQARDLDQMVRARFPEIAREVAEMMLAIRAIVPLVTAVNADLPAGAAPLKMPAERGPWSKQREVIGVREVEKWVHVQGGRRIAEDNEDRIRPAANGGFVLVFHGMGGGGESPVERRRFREVTYRPRFAANEAPDTALPDLVSLPGLAAFDRPFWLPGWHAPDAEARSPDLPRPEIEYEPL
jgi:hypothetical protein